MAAGASIRHYAAAGYPAIAIETVEEERVMAALFSGEADVPGLTRRTVVVASATGAKRHPSNEVIPGGFPAAIADVKAREDSLLVLLDWQHIAKNAGAYRVLRDALPELRARGSLVVMLAPRWELPAELVREVPVVEWALPSREELGAAVREVAESASLPVPNGDGAMAALLDSAAGLTLAESAGAMALAVSETGALDAAVVQREKLRTIRSDGALQVWAAAEASTFGGYAALQGYLRDEVVPSLTDRELAVRGMLLVGVPGTGKSLAARVCGGILGWPVLRWDISASMNSLVGESERRAREARARAEALAPCLLLIDEVEKGISGHASAMDSVTPRILGDLLTWLQEHTAPILTLMTCNDYSKLPPELTRPGRIDAQFFLDVPSASERAEIAAIHLARFGGADASGFVSLVAELCADWTGAEIEGLVRSAARRTRRALTEVALREAASHIRPIVRTKGAEIAALRQWAREALRPASIVEVEAEGPARRIRRGE